MNIRGNCQCKNIIINWAVRDFSLIARACQCLYCLNKQANWISKTGSNFSVDIRYSKKYNVMSNGTHLAKFHECLNCEDVVAVTALIDNKRYGAVNLNCLSMAHRFPTPKKLNPHNSTKTERLTSWQQNWCSPVQINLKNSA